jgi:hypothetical protein
MGFLICSCATNGFKGFFYSPPGVLVSVLSGSALLKVEVSSAVEGEAGESGDFEKERAVSFREEKTLTAGESYRFALKNGEKAVLRFESSEAVRTLLEIRKHGQTTRFVLDQDDLIGKSISVSDD